MNLSSVFTVPTFLLAVGINIVILLLRRVIQLKWPALSPHTPRTLVQNIWERVVLPTLPALLGALFCLLAPAATETNPVGFSYPAVVVGSWSRVLYGIGVGWFSGYLYTVMKFLMKKEWGLDVNLPGDSMKPAATNAALKPVEVPRDTPVLGEAPAEKKP